MSRHDVRRRRMLKALSESTRPQPASVLAKQAGDRLFTTGDAGLFLSMLEEEGLVRRVRKKYDNLWELVR